MLHGNRLLLGVNKFRLGLFALLLLAPFTRAQNSEPTAGQNDAVMSAVHDLQEQVRQLREAVVEIRSESAQYRAETLALRQQLQQTRAELAAGKTPADTWSPMAGAAVPDEQNQGSSISGGAPLQDRRRHPHRPRRLVDPARRVRRQRGGDDAARVREHRRVRR